MIYQSSRATTPWSTCVTSLQPLFPTRFGASFLRHGSCVCRTEMVDIYYMKEQRILGNLYHTRHMLFSTLNCNGRHQNTIYGSMLPILLILITTTTAIYRNRECGLWQGQELGSASKTTKQQKLFALSFWTSQAKTRFRNPCVRQFQIKNKFLFGIVLAYS